MPVHHSERSLVTGLRNLAGVAGLYIAIVVLPQCVSAQQPASQQDYDIAQRKAFTAVRRLDTGLITPEVQADYDKHVKAYRTLMASGANARNQSEMQALSAGLKYRILVLSDVTIQGDAKTLAEAASLIERDISGAGNLILNARDKETFRTLVYKQAMPFINQLMSDNFIARSMGLELLLEMEVVAARGGARLEMFDQVDDVILAILKDKDQPDAVKVRAANSAKRYLMKTNPIPQIQNSLAEALIDELNRPFVGIAYQNTILMALEYVTSPRQLVGARRPMVIDAAVAVMSDSSRELRVRCRAARVIGRAGYDAQIDFEPLAWKIAELSLEAAARFGQAQDKSAPDWDYCGWYLYTAFHHESRSESEGKPPESPKGILNRDSKSALVKAAYEASVPVISHMTFVDSAVDVRQLGKLAGWTDKNLPSNLKYDPGSPAITKAGAANNGNQPENAGP